MAYEHIEYENKVNHMPRLQDSTELHAYMSDSVIFSTVINTGTYTLMKEYRTVVNLSSKSFRELEKLCIRLLFLLMCAACTQYQPNRQIDFSTECVISSLHYMFMT